MLLSCSNACMQVWDIGKQAPKDVGRNYDLVLASNVVHTTPSIDCAPPYAPVCAGQRLYSLTHAVFALVSARILSEVYLHNLHKPLVNQLFCKLYVSMHLL